MLSRMLLLLLKVVIVISRKLLVLSRNAIKKLIKNAKNANAGIKFVASCFLMDFWTYVFLIFKFLAVGEDIGFANIWTWTWSVKFCKC